jgi:hypothetical protein
MIASLPLSRSTQTANADSPTAPDRLTWIVELMSRYAQEKCDSHDSARLAAAIVAHLKSFASDDAVRGQLADTVSHWLDTWEPILERHVAQQQPRQSESTSLYQLVMRARYA